MTPYFIELVFFMCGAGPLNLKIGELLDEDDTSNLPLGILKLRVPKYARKICSMDIVLLCELTEWSLLNVR